MKKCLKCGAEYQDDDMFCSKCGGDLAVVDACQQCGKSVSVEETYCKHCGYKIEKEYKCEKCGALIDEDSKFCKECGAKVENPVVSIKQNSGAQEQPEPVVKKQSANKSNSNGQMSLKLKRTFFYAFGGSILFFLSLMFIGCFGNIIETHVPNVIYSYIGSTKQSINISYFFNDAIKAIQDAGHLQYPEYRNYLIVKYIVELALWLLAIGLVTYGLIASIVSISKGAKNNYEFKKKPLITGLFGAFPYLFMFGLEYRIDGNIGDSSTSYDFEIGFGWGTKMILVCAILGIIAIVANDVIKAAFERKDIVKQSVTAGLIFCLILSLLVSLGAIVGISTSSSGVDVDGTMSPYYLFEYKLNQYSSGSIDKMPMYSIYAVICFIITLVAYGFAQTTIQNLLNEKSKLSTIIANGAITMTMLITGHVFGLFAIGGYIDETSSTSEVHLRFGAGCTAMIVFIIGTIVALSIINSVTRKSQQSKPQVQE